MAGGEIRPRWRGRCFEATQRLNLREPFPNVRLLEAVDLFGVVCGFGSFDFQDNFVTEGLIECKLLWKASVLCSMRCFILGVIHGVSEGCTRLDFSGKWW